MSEVEEAEQTEAFQFGSLGRHSFVYGVGMLLSKAVAIVMLPIYTRWLSPSGYGVLQLITMTFEVVTILAGSRIAVGIFHFYHKETSDRGRREVISTAFLLLTTTYTLAAAATIYYAPWIADLVFGGEGQYVTFIRLAAVSMTFEGIFLVPFALLQLQNRSTTFVLVNLARLALQVVLNLIFLIPWKMGVLGVLWGGAITTGVIGTVLAVGLISEVGVHLRPAAVRAFVRFGVPLMVMQVATFVVTFGDRYFLNVAAGTAEVGLYGLAYQFGFLVITLGFTPIQQVWDPQRFAIAKRPDRDVVYARAFIYVSVAVVTVALGIALFARDGLRLIAAPEFHSAAVFVPVLAAAYVLQSWSYFLNLGIYITERTEYFTLANWISALVALGGYLWLIPLWQAWGAVVTTFASLGVRCWLAHLFSQKLWRVEYQWAPIRRLVLLGTSVGILATFIPPLPLLVSLPLHLSLFVLYLALLWGLPILTVDERTALWRRLRRLVPS